MRTIKMPKGTKKKYGKIVVNSEITQNGSAYATRLKQDYGVPKQRASAVTAVVSENTSCRTGLSTNKQSLRRKDEAQKWGGLKTP